MNEQVIEKALDEMSYHATKIKGLQNLISRVRKYGADHYHPLTKLELRLREPADKVWIPAITNETFMTREAKQITVKEALEPQNNDVPVFNFEEHATKAARYINGTRLKGSELIASEAGVTVIFGTNMRWWVIEKAITPSSDASDQMWWRQSPEGIAAARLEAMRLNSVINSSTEQ